MDLQKVKKALELALREHNDLMLKADLPTGSKVIEEALAELEKAVGLIQQYAEAYHAKRCDECRELSADCV